MADEAARPGEGGLKSKLPNGYLSRNTRVHGAKMFDGKIFEGEWVAIPKEDFDEARSALAASRHREAEAVASLREIAKREGPYSRDALTHASNTIDAMGAIADQALALLAATSGGER